MAVHINLRNGGVSLVFNLVDETLEIAHWGAELPEVTDASLLATKRPIAHGDLDVNPRNLILREHSRAIVPANQFLIALYLPNMKQAPKN